MSNYYENPEHAQDCQLRYITAEDAKARDYGCTCAHRFRECVNGSCRSMPIKQAVNVPEEIAKRHEGHLLVNVTQFRHDHVMYYCFNCGFNEKGRRMF